MQDYHISVLKKEALEFLAVDPGKQYIDATLGGGGHTEAILERGGRVLGIDVDEEAHYYVQEKFKVQNPKFKVDGQFIRARGNFKDIDSLAKANGFRKVAGILFDLGVSSHQFDEPERGFSFRESGPLDMRMDQDMTVGAKDLINGLTEKELADLFYRLGEEYQSRLVAKEIVRERMKKPIETTGELEKIVRHALGGRARTSKVVSIHPATKVFQALRIAVNDELHTLEEALPKALGLLEPNGRLVVISFHSMEDRIVKNTFREFSSRGLGHIVTDKPVTPGEAEIAVNPRARSAKLRAFERKI
jgi:16S rRNA (cytosine1402-N4)-methyltransferase